MGGILFVFSKPFHFLLHGSAGFYAGFKDIPSVKELPDALVTAFDVLAVRGKSNFGFGSVTYDGDWWGKGALFVNSSHSDKDLWAYIFYNINSSPFH